MKGTTGKKTHTHKRESSLAIGIGIAQSTEYVCSFMAT